MKTTTTQLSEKKTQIANLRKTIKDKDIKLNKLTKELKWADESKERHCVQETIVQQEKANILNIYENLTKTIEKQDWDGTAKKCWKNIYPKLKKAKHQRSLNYFEMKKGGRVEMLRSRYKDLKQEFKDKDDKI